MDRARCYNVPKYHAKLWEEYAETSDEVSRVLEAGETRAHGFDAFANELHHRLYAELPREVEADKRAPAAALRAKLHALASELPEFSTLRKQTVRDPIWAGMAAAALGDSVTRALPELPESTPDADRARQLLDGLCSLADQSPEMAEALDSECRKAADGLIAAEKSVDAQANGIDESAIRNALRAGIAQAQADIDEAQSAIAALGWGTGVGESATAKSPGVAVELARRVRGSASLKRIVELAGRMILTARAKRATRSEYARSEIVGVEQTGDVSRILPTELSALSSPTTTAALYRRLLERAALGYKVAGSERCAKGPIVIAIDQSGSMLDGGKDEWAKAIALALLDAARAEKRAFGVILYNGAVADARLFPKAADVDPRVLLDMLSTRPDGGTNYAPAITQALDWISTAGTFKRADIIHVTDGDASTAAAEEHLARAKQLGVHIFGIGIGNVGSALGAWSHEVTRITDVRSDAPAIDLVFDNV